MTIPNKCSDYNEGRRAVSSIRAPEKNRFGYCLTLP